MTKSCFDTEEIRKLALQLFASLFYFDEKEQRDGISDDENSLQGIAILVVYQWSHPLT